MASHWQVVVEKKRALQREALAAFRPTEQGPRQDGFGDEDITLISNIDEVSAAIECGKITARVVTEAFIDKVIGKPPGSGILHQAQDLLVPAKDEDFEVLPRGFSYLTEKKFSLTEIAFESAIQRAGELDDYRKRTGSLIGPLHGVPVTLKDQFNVQGLDTTLGYVGRCFNPAPESAILVKILEHLGAIVLAKTNIPQSIMWCETDNPLWGKTTNPKDASYTPGGSTGGEACLLSCNASILGWGTDIGGSIRIPAHMMGLYGLKPSSARLPYRGVPVSTEGQEHVPSSVGPLARSLHTLTVATRSVINSNPWKLDPKCFPMPWRSGLYGEVFEQPLTVAVLYDDEVVQPHPPSARILKQAVDLLQKDGHDIINWNADLHPECIEVMDRFYTADGGEDVNSSIAAGGEPLIPHVEKLFGAAKAISVYQYWQLNKRKIELQQAYLDKWASIRSSQTGRPADVLLMPPMPHSSVPHQGCRWVGYTKVWNFLDYPALVIPGGAVNTQDMEVVMDGAARNSMDEWNRQLWEDRKGEMAALQMPVGVQLVCPKLEEEKLLAVGKILDNLLRRAKT